MKPTFRIDGLDELLRAMRALPAALTDEANAIVARHAEEAAAEMKAVYDAHRVTGDLAKGVGTRKAAAGRYGAAVEIYSRAFHVHFFESGTEARHYITTKNQVKKYVGRMPALPTFIPAMRRHRFAMWNEIAALLRAHGLEVRGVEDLGGAA